MAICDHVCVLALCAVHQIPRGKRNMREKNAECLREVPRIEPQKRVALRVR